MDYVTTELHINGERVVVWLQLFHQVQDRSRQRTDRMEGSEGSEENFEFEHGSCDILQRSVVVLQIDRGKRVRDLHADEVVIGGD